MRIKEYETYKSVYCAVCKSLGKNYGITARLILSYDITFLALVGLAVKAEPVGIKKGRCTCNPLKRCLYCTGGDEPIDFACAAGIILFYYKLYDNISDDGFFGRIISRLLLVPAGVKRKKAQKKYSELDTIFSDMIKSQLAAEKNENCTIDEAAEPTAIALAKTAEMLTDDSKKQKELYRFGYFLGKWIYLTDAQADLYDDIQKKSFNPFAVTGSTEDELNRAKEYANSVINSVAAELVSAYIELDIQMFSPIIENIIVLGLRDSQKRAFEKEKKKK